jgi:hypothetical protein
MAKPTACSARSRRLQQINSFLFRYLRKRPRVAPLAQRRGEHPGSLFEIRHHVLDVTRGASSHRYPPPIKTSRPSSEALDVTRSSHRTEQFARVGHCRERSWYQCSGNVGVTVERRNTGRCRNHRLPTTEPPQPLTGSSSANEEAAQLPTDRSRHSRYRFGEDQPPHTASSRKLHEGARVPV